MRILLAALLISLAACDFQHQPAQGSSVTVTLPPPKPAVAPGFSQGISSSVR